ncbi:hypothetical protein F4778DRAFT_798015 [Xylariomycetidae sp. FL2044]|nr:hypothetical protein F4778DRAFT_798015 [Xylariomycetidae sp. FL2044]
MNSSTPPGVTLSPYRTGQTLWLKNVETEEDIPVVIENTFRAITEYVQSSSMADLAARIEQFYDKRRKGVSRDSLPASPGGFLAPPGELPAPPGDKSKVERLGEREAEIWYRTNRQYEKEVAAYNTLRKLQGRCIPPLLAYVTLDLPSAPPKLDRKFCTVPGLLLGLVDGFVLEDIWNSVPFHADQYQQIIQSTVKVIEKVTRAGVIHHDIAPRNIVVGLSVDGSWQPFLVDFANSTCRSLLRDPEHMTAAQRYQHLVNQREPAKTFGDAMKRQIRKKMGFEMNIEYSNLSEVSSTPSNVDSSSTPGDQSTVSSASKAFSKLQLSDDSD